MRANNKRRCKRCGQRFWTDTERELCMECLCSQHDRPQGQQQADEVDHGGEGNPDATFDISEQTPPHSVAERLADGFRMLGAESRDNR